MMLLFLSLLCLAAAGPVPHREPKKLMELLAKDKNTVTLSEVIIKKLVKDKKTEINVCHDGTKKIENAHLITKMKNPKDAKKSLVMDYGKVEDGMSLEGKQCYNFSITSVDDSWKTSTETEFILQSSDSLEAIEKTIKADNGTLVFGYGKAGKYVPIAGFESAKTVECPVAKSVVMTFPSPKKEFGKQCKDNSCLFSSKDKNIAAEYFDKDAKSKKLPNTIVCLRNNKADDEKSPPLQNNMFFCDESPTKTNQLAAEGDAIDLDSLDYKLKQFIVKTAMSAKGNVFMFKGSEGETFLDSINVDSGSNNFTIPNFEKSSDIYTACPVTGEKGQSLQDLEVKSKVYKMDDTDITSFSFVNKYYDDSKPEKTLEYTATAGKSVIETIDCSKIKSNAQRCYGFMDGAKKKFTIEKKSGNMLSNIVVTVPEKHLM